MAYNAKKKTRKQHNPSPMKLSSKLDKVFSDYLPHHLSISLNLFFFRGNCVFPTIKKLNHNLQPITGGTGIFGTGKNYFLVVAISTHYSHLLFFLRK